MAEEKNSPSAQRVVVDIYGTSYPLKTDNPQHMKQLAAALDKRMKIMSRAVRTFDERKIAVLTALEIAEDYYKLKKDYDELVDLLDEK
ncbi:cell division protein ZapA [Selenomonas ruminantium]|uniref:Cell division protein ZapA n=1 Tax=Selenomonas ruminantium TaxID=971 RepID=A0A1H0S8K1_SELRU|nr:cell division protein ZapA [Selenomonas ruminantium]SDP38064.1 cell division protein ZapA [Selenomonas ruminantium]